MAQVNSPFYEDLALLAKQLDPSPFFNKKILITGASGLIGSAVTKLLLMLPLSQIQIYASGRSEERLQKCFKEFLEDNRLHLFEWDIVRPLATDTNFDYLIDCASPGNPKSFNDSPVDVILANIYGVNNLLTYAISHKLKRIIYVSSGEIYGEGDGRDFSEEYSGFIDPLKFRSCYPTSKRAAETLCIAYLHQYRIPVTIVRPCHIFGPNFTITDDRAYAQFFKNIINDEDIVLKSNGSQIRSWLYVADCAMAIVYLLLYGQDGEAYNISPTNETASLFQFASLIAREGGKNIKTIINMSSPDPIITRGVLSPQKINILGWKNLFTLQDGIKRTILELKRDC